MNLARSTPAPSGLASSEALDEVEALMLSLSVGERLDRLGGMLQEHLDGGGRRTRARLALAAAEALGVPRAVAVPWAAACELLHNATLVHDDVQDGDTRRRGRPTLWARHGVAQAINAGDLLLMLPYRALEALDCDDAVRWRLSRALARAAERTARGQAAELDLVPHRRLDWRAWTDASAGKSGALLGLPVEGAALLAGLDAATAEALGAAFVELGVLYQAHDDVTDLWGDKGRGARGNDLREGKASALVAAHLEAFPDETEAIVALLELPREATPDADVEALITRFESDALPRVEARIAALEAAVLGTPELVAAPALHAVAVDVIHLLRALAPRPAGR